MCGIADNAVVKASGDGIRSGTTISPRHPGERRRRGYAVDLVRDMLRGVCVEDVS